MNAHQCLLVKNRLLRLSHRWIEGYRRVKYSRLHDQGKVESAEESKFANCGMNLEAAQRKLDSVLKNIDGRSFNRNDDSVHWLLFSAISLEDAEYKRILEIGTATGRFTMILSELFPNSQIDTVDLPESDPLLRFLYGRENEKRFVEFNEAQRRYTKSKRINVFKINSFFVPETLRNQYDLIWVDGGHLYPEIAWDLCNAYHACRRGGYLLCDDVIISKKPLESKYVSNASFEVINYFSQRSRCDVHFFLKRLGSKWNSQPINRKYVACIKKG